MATEENIYEKLTFGIVKSLEKRPGIVNIKQTPKVATDRPSIVSWEQKYSCMMPDDLRNFYLTSNGFLLTWSAKLNDNRIPVGHMEINPLEKLIRIGSMGSVDPSSNVPTLADVELADHGDDDRTSGELLTPRFDHRCRVFELDPCEGYGKVCYVYRNTKPGIPATKSEVWFLDRALRWHYLADSFINYYRLMLVHLGLPQWQYSFTDIGLSPQAKQWFHLYCPVRLGMDGQCYEMTEQDADINPIQIDVSKVFKAKTDKKKLPSLTAQNTKRKPISSAKGTGAGRPGQATAQPAKVFR